MTQDDLRLLAILRAFREGGASEAKARKTLSVSPGRAAGQVAAWSATKTASVLDRFERRACERVTTPHPGVCERRLLVVARHLADRDLVAAEAAATWLVPGASAPALCRALSPLAEAILPAAPSADRARVARAS